MIARIIAFSIKNKLIIVLLTVFLILGGLWSMTKVPLDAVPDITNNQVQIITQAPKLGTVDIEQFVTYPVEVAMSNLPGVIEIRSVSRFGLSLVTVVFEDDIGTYLPRQLVSEELTKLRDEIPEGFGEPYMGPISTGLGEIYQYTLDVDPEFQHEYSLTELRTIQDWIVSRQMAMVPGVVEINSFGGLIKQYEVAVKPDELRAIGVTIPEIYEALERNNQITGGAYIEKDHYANFIRGEGLARNIEDIENIVVKNTGGIPVMVKDIAQVRFGHAIRYGAFTKDGKGEAVGGIIFMLKGENSNEVVRNVKERMAEIQESLPEGVSIEPFLDRSDLISSTTSTVSINLTEGALIVIFVLVFLLGNWRGGLIVASTIPLSLLFAFILMNVFDVWANLMSLGAIDFGIIVDGAVIIVESTVFLLHEKVLKREKIDQSIRDQTAYSASKKMMNSAFFGQLIILIVFIPILALEGIEGKMFRPMALTFVFAMIGVMILCLTYVPVMSAWFIRTGKENKVSWGDRAIAYLENVYQKLLRIALARGKVVIVGAVILLGLAVFTFSRLGAEFIPQLDEGDIAFHIILKPGSTLSESIKTSTRIERILLDNFPEVEHAMTRFGVADVPTDPMPMDIGDCFVMLKPKDEWVSAHDKEELVEKIKESLTVVPGVNYEFTQPIEMRFNELLTGVREDIAIKLFGEDLDILASKAEEIGRIIAPVEGVADMKVEATGGLPQMTVNYERQKLAQYGLNIDNLNMIVQSAFAGSKAGVIFEGEKRFDLVIRLAEEERQSIEDLRNLYINLENGSQIPLKEVADISYKTGPMQISRDNTNRRVNVGINVRGRDIKSLVEEIRAKLDTELSLPPGYYIRYGGAFENLEKATQRLKIVVPIALVLIFLLIFLSLGSVKQTIMIYMVIPMAAIGGVYSLWLRDMHFSISAGIGFIVLFGIAVLNGLVLISGWNDLKEEGKLSLDERIRKGAKRRIRPVLLTASTDILGFLPMAVSVSAGAEVQRPLATVVIGGMITATFLTLFILPVLYHWVESNSTRPYFRSSAIPFLVIIMVLIAGNGTSAQEVRNINRIDPESAIQIAKENYPELKVKLLEIDREKAMRKTAWDLGTTHVFTSGEELGNSGGVYTRLGIQQQNMDIFGIAPKNHLHNNHVEVAKSSYDLTEIELEFSVKKTYGELYVRGKLYDIYTRMDSLFKEFSRTEKMKYEIEESSQLTYLSADIQYREINNMKNQAYHDLIIALENFNLFLNADTMTYSVSEDIPGEWLMPVAQPADFLKDHPAVELANNRKELSRTEMKLARSEFLPQLNLLYGIQEVNDAGGFYQYQVGVTLPLFFMKERGKLQSAKLKNEIEQQKYSLAVIRMQNEFRTAWEEYKKWQSSWQYYKEEALVFAERQRESTLRAYKQGSIDYAELFENTRYAMEIEINAFQTLRNYLEARFKLEFLMNPDKN